MPILIKRSTATFIVLFVLNLLVTVSAFYILPKRFFYDAVIIAFDKGNEIGFFGSYPLTILFYKITGLRYLPFPVVGLIQFPILMYLLYKIGIPEDFEKLNIKNIIVYLGIFMIAVYLSMPSKEFITFPYVSLVVFLFLNQRIAFRKVLYISLSLLIIFGIFYRPYFVLIPIIAIGMYVASLMNFKNKTLTVIFYGLVLAILLSLCYGVVSGHYFSEVSRELVNSPRLGSADANSMIVSPVKPDTWYGETIGILYGFFSVNVPVNGIKYIFSPQILVFVIWQLFLFYILLVRFSRCIQAREKYKKELWVLLILFAFFIVQGVFEPDLGSAVRHKIGVFPLIYYALYYGHFRKKLQ
ncbi:hypothetical protein [Flavobacterium gilvum]|uniref:Uncharacterized protein n=1 Tax=Flavobacterium gilvum TaxID=1492737 RepID=A0AAC9I6C3_9FLAO|nr:hypothetical protein [Flavobacterium gilvum]AOW08702.1 hypothetical protein EM308_03850 [Flavobacterium gilvum]KFC59865.1 hypothetical protein FEM08_13760 [Flavobacterium gilvum]